MKKYKATKEDMIKKYNIDEDWELVGKINGDVPVYICERDFLIIERHIGYENYNVYEFEQNEVTELEFKPFALKYCRGFFNTFLALYEEEAKKAEKKHNEILDFIRNGLYGETRHFYNKDISFDITIVPGGYIYNRSLSKESLFVPYEAIQKEIAFKIGATGNDEKIQELLKERDRIEALANECLDENSKK